MPFHIATLEARPDLVSQADALTNAIWSGFMSHDPIGIQHFNTLYARFPDCQFVLLDERDLVVGVGHSIPFQWDGALSDLPETGWDWVLPKGLHDSAAGCQANLLSALSIVLRPDLQGQGLSPTMVQGMRETAQRRHAKALVVPLRPTGKARHPAVAMEDYLTWKDAQGLPFDPWLRVHVRAGARLLHVAPRSMTIPGTLAQWEAWAKMTFPRSGSYLVPGALAPVQIDLATGQGLYIEPNVWLHHPL